jgi:hypothetical protein
VNVACTAVSLGSTHVFLAVYVVKKSLTRGLVSP